MTIPDRPSGARTGTDFCATLPDALNAERESAMLAELLSGNVPALYRNFVPVSVHDPNIGELTFLVAHDYLAVGDDEDHVRLPLNPLSAQRIADTWECLLPTKKMVDVIWRAAPTKLVPQPLPPTSAMTSVRWFLQSNVKINEHLELMSSHLPGGLVAGHKKDVVITPRTFSRPGKVAIYGWHQPGGHPIQQLNEKSHDDKYADYSHGIRLIAQECFLDGSATTVASILADPQLCKLLSDEGPIQEPKYRV